MQVLAYFLIQLALLLHVRASPDQLAPQMDTSADVASAETSTLTEDQIQKRRSSSPAQLQQVSAFPYSPQRVVRNKWSNTRKFTRPALKTYGDQYFVRGLTPPPISPETPRYLPLPYPIMSGISYFLTPPSEIIKPKFPPPILPPPKKTKITPETFFDKVREEYPDTEINFKGFDPKKHPLDLPTVKQLVEEILTTYEDEESIKNSKINIEIIPLENTFAGLDGSPSDFHPESGDFSGLSPTIIENVYRDIVTSPTTKPPPAPRNQIKPKHPKEFHPVLPYEPITPPPPPPPPNMPHLEEDHYFSSLYPERFSENSVYTDPSRFKSALESIRLSYLINTLQEEGRSPTLDRESLDGGPTRYSPSSDMVQTYTMAIPYNDLRLYDILSKIPDRRPSRSRDQKAKLTDDLHTYLGAESTQ